VGKLIYVNIVRYVISYTIIVVSKFLRIPHIDL